MEKFDNGWDLTPEEQLEHIKKHGELFPNQIGFLKLDFLTLLGWEQTSFKVVFEYEKGGVKLSRNIECDEHEYYVEFPGKSLKQISEDELIKIAFETEEAL